ncbi:MAG: sigma-70 family RNA polymerase sigma factor [Bacillota bacterium]
MEERRETLIIKYIPLAKSLCKKFKNLNHQERYSEALYGLTLAAIKFDFENFPVKAFSNYAKTIILNRLKKLTKNDIVKIDWSEVEAREEDGYDKMKYLKSNENPYYELEALDYFKKELDERKFEIMKLLIDDYTQSEIADKTNLSQSTISREIKSIKEELYEDFMV